MGNQNSAPPQGHVALVLGESLVLQPFPTAAVGVQYCSPTPVEYEISAIRWAHFVVRDPTTHATCFCKERKTFRTRETLVDVREHGIRVPVLNFYYDIVRPGPDDAAPELLKMTAKVELDTAELQVSFVDLTTGERCFMGVEGNWRLHQAFLWLKRGYLGAEREAVARVWAPGGDGYYSNREYTLTVAPNVDVALIVCLCMALDLQWAVYDGKREML